MSHTGLYSITVKPIKLGPSACAMSTPACCPDGSAPYLAASYTPKGTIIEDCGGGVSLYFAPVPGDEAPTKAVLFCPDVLQPDSIPSLTKQV